MSPERFKPMQIVSYDADKVRIVTALDNSTSVYKTTTDNEFEHLKLMKSKLEMCSSNSILWKAEDFSIHIPEIKSWNNETHTMEMSHLKGDNLEILLRETNRENRVELVELIANVIGWMKQSGCLWIDAAPRNILIDNNAKSIGFVDFEKGAILQDFPFTNDVFSLYVRGIINEEFSAFLFQHEQEIVFGDIWNVRDMPISNELIQGKREKLLYEYAFGKIGNEVSLADLTLIQKLMSEMVTPFYVEDEVFYPLVYLDHYRGAESYTNAIIELSKIDKVDWPAFLKSNENSL